ncbi:MAG: alpha-ketoglutarate-dependent dioxygenase AlkB [Rhodoglobus sp.]|nr:alpha-ketoglutarate-dependent dioxygenase AlkB [Rhodoglobus sp.]
MSNKRISPTAATTTPGQEARGTDGDVSPSRAPFHPEGFVRRELLDGGELLYIPSFFDSGDADALFAELRDGIPWEHARMMGQLQKLATYWIGSVPYAYSRQTRPAAPWLPDPRAIGAAVESFLFAGSGDAFEGVLLNYYKTSDVKLGLHADSEPIMVPDSPIASLSLGAERDLQIRHGRKGSSVLSVPLAHGSLLIMGGATQRHYQHQVPKRARCSSPRLNLTFRVMR